MFKTVPGPKCKICAAAVIILTLFLFSCRDMWDEDGNEGGRILFSYAGSDIGYIHLNSPGLPELFAVPGIVADVMIDVPKGYMAGRPGHAVYYQYGGDLILYDIKESFPLNTGITGTIYAKASPDSSMVAYSDIGNYYIYHLESAPPGDLLPVPNDGDNIGISWSPDSENIVVVSEVLLNVFDLFIYNKDSGSSRQITFTESTYRFPDWSPAGNYIAYQSDYQNAPLDYDIWIIKPDGTGMQNLTNTPGAAEQFPAYSPDGKKIAFLSDFPSPYTLYVINNDGTGLRQLTDGTFSAVMGIPSWSPYGTRIAFVSAWSGINEIWTVNPDGSDLKQMTFSVVGSVNPVWLRD